MSLFFFCQNYLYVISYIYNFICFLKIESLYPKEMGPGVMTVEDFLNRGLLLLDKDIQDRVEKAASNGNVLRYVCVIMGSRNLRFPPFAHIFFYLFIFNSIFV